MNNVTPSAGRLAYISPIIELAEPGKKLQTFVEQVRTAGSLLRDGFWTAEIVERELRDIARAHNLASESGSAEEIIDWEIEKAIAIDDDEPRATNGHDDGPPPPNGPDDYGEPIVGIDRPARRRQIGTANRNSYSLRRTARLARA
jgi:hypothetical protein